MRLDIVLKEEQIDRGRWVHPSSSVLFRRQSRVSERKSGGELENAAGDRGRGDLTDAWVGNTGGKRGGIEIVAGISEARMAQDVESLHPKLQFALLPPRQAPTFGQRKIDIRQPRSTKRISLVVAETIGRWRYICELVEPLV